MTLTLTLLSYDRNDVRSRRLLLLSEASLEGDKQWLGVADLLPGEATLPACGTFAILASGDSVIPPGDEIGRGHFLCSYVRRDLYGNSV